MATSLNQDRVFICALTHIKDTIAVCSGFTGKETETSNPVFRTLCVGAQTLMSFGLTLIAVVLGQNSF